MSLLLVSHDFSVVAGMTSRVGVMYAGQLVEEGSVSDVLLAPRHPYTRALIESLPEGAASGPLRSIPGAPPAPGDFPEGCAFAPRCPLVTKECVATAIPMNVVKSNHLSRCIHVDRMLDRNSETVPSGMEKVPADG